MARRKASQAPSAPRSTAAIFADPEFEAKLEPAPQEKPQKQEPDEEEDDDPFDHPFPLNYLYATQDFLNEQLDARKFIQVILLVYVIQLFYAGNKELVMKYIDIIGVNFLGVFIEVVVSYNLQSKKFKAGLIEDSPKIPEFNTIYAVLLPSMLFLLNDYKVVENLSYNYFVVDNLPIVAKCFSAVLFVFLYDTDEAVPFLSKTVVFIFLGYMIRYINSGNEEHVVTKEVESQDIDYSEVEIKGNSIKTGFNESLSTTEIHLIIVGFMNLFFNLKGYSFGTIELDSHQLNLVIFQKLLLSLITSILFSYPIFLFSRLASIVTFIAGFVYLNIYQLTPVLQQNPLVYLQGLVLENQQLFGIWTGTLLVFIALIFNVELEFNFRRKIWHFIVVSTILPSLILSRDFTVLALLGFIILLMITEVLRINKLTFVGQQIYNSFYKFQDFKDLKGPLNLSYIYLIVGILIPIVLEYSLKEQFNIKSFIGLISIGLGDAVASIIGKALGRVKYFGSKKTVEGSLGFFFVNIAGYLALTKYLEFPQINNELLFLVCFLGSIFEGVVTMNDNIFIPLIMYISWEILERTV